MREEALRVGWKDAEKKAWGIWLGDLAAAAGLVCVDFTIFFFDIVGSALVFRFDFSGRCFASWCVTCHLYCFGV